jgi:hypothetical protein
MSADVQEFDFSVNLLRALLWRHDDAEHLQSILTDKSEWYLENHTEFWNNWITDVFDLRTANDFGCSVWALILGVPLNIITPVNQGPQFGFGAQAYTTPYNVAAVADQPATGATVSSMRRAGGWQGDRALYSTARTNLLGQSEAYGTGWTITRSSVPQVSNVQTLRATNAYKLTEDTSAGTHLMQRASTGTVANGAVGVVSAYVKAGERSQLRFGFSGSGAFAAATVTADLNTGTLSVTTGAPLAYGMTPASGKTGWWRVWMTMTATAAGAGTAQFILSNNGLSSYAGDGTSGMYIDAAQLEVTNLTPYIACPTTAIVSVTDYTMTTAGVLTFAVLPGSVAQDRVYGSGSYTKTGGGTVTFTNRLIAHAWTNNHRYNFGHGNFGISQAGAGLTLEQKRVLLQLRYYQLVSRCTVPEINERVSDILGDFGKVYVLDGNNMQYVTYVFGFQPNSALQFILENFDVLPRPAGVGVKIVVSTRPAFGFGTFNKNFNNGNFWAEN